MIIDLQETKKRLLLQADHKDVEDYGKVEEQLREDIFEALRRILIKYVGGKILGPTLADDEASVVVRISISTIELGSRPNPITAPKTTSQ